jgi:hypothetical protein
MIKIKLPNRKTSKINLHAGNFTARQSAEIRNMGLAFQNRGQINEQ